jgi:tetratricopeptide (TPR) repeat protein
MVALIMAAAIAAAANADEAFARGDFTAAFRDYNDALIANPDDEEAVLGMGTLDLYRNDWRNARIYLERAQQLDPKDTRAIARLRTLRRRLPRPGLYHFEIPTGRADIPMIGNATVPIVRASIDGHTLNLVVDTRHRSIALDPQAAQMLGVVDHSLLSSVEFPGLTVAGVPVHVLTGPLDAAGTNVDGAIGTVFLSHFLPTFDFAHGMLTLQRWEASPKIESQAAQSHATVQPFWLIGDELLVTRERFEGGPMGLFALETARASSIEPVEPGAFSNVPFDVAGTLGIGFFRPTTVTFDFATMQIVIDR